MSDDDDSDWSSVESLALPLIELADSANDIVSEEFKKFVATMESNGDVLSSVFDASGDSDHARLFRFLLGEDGQKHLHNHLRFVLTSRIVDDLDVDIEFGSSTTLAFAAERACLECVSLLLMADADTNAVDSMYGRTPLHGAVIGGNLAIVELLLENEADVTAEDAGGRTPLHFAESCAIIKCLVDAGADVNAAAAETPLTTLVCGSGANVNQIIPAVQCLIECGAQADLRDESGLSALHRCAQQGQIVPVNDASERRAFMQLLAVLIANGASFDGSPNFMDIWSGASGDIGRLFFLLGLRPVQLDIVRLLEAIKYEGDEIFVSLLRTFVCHLPTVATWISDAEDEVKKQVFVDEWMKQEKQAMLDVKRDWEPILLSFCASRVVDIAMIFKHLPTLVLVEICLYDQPCLQTIEQSLIWPVVEKVRQITTTIAPSNDH